MKTTSLIVFLLLTSFFSQAQKVKYKDLHVLLRAKNYKDAAPFLVKFLSDNPEHPNANYQMGLMLEFKLGELDLLKESEMIIKRADSAILYFNKAYSLINEKEVKKHDNDYYALFKRRNLRTGKFEVILSDVQLDIENRKSVLEKKKANIISINLAFNNASNYYEEARLSYQLIKSKYGDELSLALGAADSTVLAVKQLIIGYDSALLNFKKYLNLKKLFDSGANETVIIVNPIKNFSETALESPNFYAKKVVVNDFSEWGTYQLKQIELKADFQNNLIVFDNSLDVLFDRIRKDSVDLSNEIFNKVTDPYLKEITLTDPESLPYNLFHYKIGQLNLNSALMSWYNSYQDTLDVGLQLNFAHNLQKEMKGVESLYQSLLTYNDTLLIIRYQQFIKERYQTKENLINFLNNQKEVVAHQTAVVDSLVTSVTAKDNWGYFRGDSISLSVINDSTLTYQTLYVDSLADRSFRVLGLTKKLEKDRLFFSIIPSSRMIDTVYVVETQFTSSDLLVQSVDANNEFCVYLLGDIINTPESMVLIYFSDRMGVNWQKTIALNSEVAPKLVYEQGLIEIHQGDIIKKYRLDDGTEKKE